jgi:peptidoglycan hydrolase FlgJ
MEMKAIPLNALPVADLQPTTPSPKGRRAAGDPPAAAKKVATEFEAMFLGMMLKSMRDTVGKDKLTGGGHGEETFRSLLDQEYASAAARGGGIGLSRMIEKELNHAYTAAPAPVQGGSDADR